MDTKKDPRGRPRKPAGEVRSKLIKLRVTPGEHAAINKAAKYMQYKEVSEFIRWLVKQYVKASESRSGVESVLAIGRSSTAGWERIPDLDLAPMEIIWDTEESKPKLVDVMDLDKLD